MAVSKDDYKRAVKQGVPVDSPADIDDATKAEVLAELIDEGRSFSDSVLDFIHAVREKAAEAVEDVGEKVADFLDPDDESESEEDESETYPAAELEEVKEDAGDVLEEAGDLVEEVVEDVKDAVSDAIDDVFEDKDDEDEESE